MRSAFGRAPALLGRGGARRVAIAIGLLLVSPALGVGPMGDDYMHLARLDPQLSAPGFPYAPLDLFTFVSGEPTQREELREEGVFGWWMAPDFKMSFWRPLSSLTHVLDHQLWPRSFVLAHAQSMLWFAALLAVLGVLYGRFHVPWVAHLALLLYAVDDAHGWVLGWVANRNVLVAATLAFTCLLIHDRARRDGWRPGLWLAPLLFAAALLGGEAALGMTGYLFAYALFIDSGPLAWRLGRLWPYAALSIAWLAAYMALGYGTSGGGMYLNPVDEPAAYAGALAERLPILAAAQVGLGIADAWVALPAAPRTAAFAGAILVLAAFAVVLAPVWRLTVCRFWVIGAVLSLPPMCATYPMDRLLVFAGVGAMAAIALVLADWLQANTRAVPSPARRLLAAAAAATLLVLHLVLAPALLPARVLLVGFLARMGERLEASIPADDAVRAKTLLVLSSSAEMTTFPPWMQRQVSGSPRPRRMRVLASCFSDVRVSRPDATTLRVRPERGFLDNEWLRMVRGPSRPFHTGDEVALSDIRVRVRSVTGDGRPAEADFTFRVPLEDPSLLWRRLQAGGTLVAWSPPRVGESQLLPAIVPLQAGP
jgi:hypothetical protein